jgi:hypothetical protein
MAVWAWWRQEKLLISKAWEKNLNLFREPKNGLSARSWHNKCEHDVLWHETWTWRIVTWDLNCLHLHGRRVNVRRYLIYQTVRCHIPAGRNNDTSSYSADSNNRNVVTLHQIRNNLGVLQHTTFIIANPIAAACFGCTKQPSSSRVNLINGAETCSCY